MPNLRLQFLAVVLSGVAVGSAVAQDAAQFQKLYEDTLVQLQQSQDRKNQLANENAKLLEQIAELEKQVRTLRSAVDRAELMAAQYSAFRTFLTRYPALQANFSSSEAAPERSLPQTSYEFFDRNWPFSALAASTAAGGA